MMAFHKLFNKIARRTDYEKMELRMYHAYMKELYPERYGSEESPVNFEGDTVNVFGVDGKRKDV